GRRGARDGGDHDAEREQQQRRRHVPPPGEPAHRFLDQAEAGVAHCGLPLPAQEPEIRGDQQRQGERQPEHLGPLEAHATALTLTRLRRRRSSMKRLISSTRSTSVESSIASTPESRKALRSPSSRFAAAAAKRLRNFGSCVSTNSCSPVSASRNRSKPRSGSSLSSGSCRRTATTSWRIESCPRRAAQPGALMKSETTNTRERREMAFAPAT